MLFFSRVDEIDPFLIRWDMLRFTRNNQSYQMLLSICWFVLEGLLLTTEDGGYRLAQFLNEQRMCRLYEKFILELYRKEVREVKANATEIKWQLDDGQSSLLPTMKSDIMLTRGDKTLIIDAKYYSHTTQVQFGQHSLISANIYQIFAYVKNKDLGQTGKIAGLLLYAQTDEEMTPKMSVSINKNQISAQTLNLSLDFQEIAAQLKKIAEDYFQY